MKTYSGFITTLPPNGIFVFGSNTQGRHGAGAAAYARKHFRAIYGQPMGLQGRSYAIVTKDLTKQQHPSIDRWQIQKQITQLYLNALCDHQNDYYVAYTVGDNNLNGYTSKEMAEMFVGAIAPNCCIPGNIIFEQQFSQLILSLIPQIKPIK